MRKIKDRPEMTALIEKAKARFAAMTPEEQEAELTAQRESWVRGEMAMGEVTRAEARQAPRLAQNVIDLVIAAREFWDVHNDLSEESNALDKALERFSEQVPYENGPSAPLPAGTVTEERESVVSKDVILADLPNMVRRVRKDWPAIPEDVVRDMLLVAMCCESCVSVATYWREKAESRPAEPMAVTDEMVESVANAMIAALADGRARVNADEPTTITNLNVTALARAALASITETGGTK